MLWDAFLITVLCSRYSVWCLSYYSLQVHGILCDACLFAGHRFTVFCVMLGIVHFTSSRYYVWCLPYYSSQVHSILCDACPITVHKFTLLCCVGVMLALWHFISSRYFVILCDACFIKSHRFTVFCLMLALFQVISSRYSVWYLSYYSSEVHGILCDKGNICSNQFDI